MGGVAADEAVYSAIEGRSYDIDSVGDQMLEAFISQTLSIAMSETPGLVDKIKGKVQLIRSGNSLNTSDFGLPIGSGVHYDYEKAFTNGLKIIKEAYEEAAPDVYASESMGNS